MRNHHIPANQLRNRNNRWSWALLWSHHVAGFCAWTLFDILVHHGQNGGIWIGTIRGGGIQFIGTAIGNYAMLYEKLLLNPLQWIDLSESWGPALCVLLLVSAWWRCCCWVGLYVPITLSTGTQWESVPTSILTGFTGVYVIIHWSFLNWIKQIL